MSFYNKDMLSDYRAERRGNVIMKTLLPVIVSGLYVYKGWEPAALAGLIFAAYQLLDIAILLRYQNLLIEKQVGLHDLD